MSLHSMPTPSPSCLTHTNDTVSFDEAVMGGLFLAPFVIGISITSNVCEVDPSDQLGSSPIGFSRMRRSEWKLQS